ncbi:MAG: hypothetical protein A2Z88_10415 [Omnitrophica WOR_2 bacterium GWA2_47_8]|nr:MAG: hypothetical protein A2Z88_10415 [Omnitrophica WOR_2 bacterium GWA2_47_8]
MPVSEQICHHCKNPIYDDEALLCHYCGESLGRISRDAIGQLRGGWGKWIWVLIALSALASFILLTFR